MSNPDAVENNAVEDVSGHCLCGGVRYEAAAVRRRLVQCHCETCRRAVGAVWQATQALREDLTIEDDGCLAWYRSSGKARRGFCGRCGSSLFFDHDDRPTMGIAAGTIDQPSGLELAADIHVDDAADYEVLSAEVPSFPDGRHGIAYP